jgi:hypothetical protein
MTSPVTVTATIDGVGRVIDRIGGMEERLKRARPAMEVIADLLEGHVGKTFSTQGARIGKPWWALAASTVIARTRGYGYYGQRSAAMGAGPTGPVLVWSGRLMRSFRRGGVAHVRNTSDTGLLWGSGVRYGRFHQGPGPRQRLILGFRNAMQLREIAFQPLRLWVQGVEAGAIKTTLSARLGLPLV